MIHLRVRGLSCEPRNQLDVCATSVTEGEVGTVKHVLAPPPPPVIHYWPSQGGGSDVVVCCLFLVSEFR